MKIVFLGTDAFLTTFISVAKSHEIVALYSCSGSEDFFRDSEVIHYAVKSGIPVHYHTITPEEEKEYIRDGVRLFLSADYGRKIPILSKAEGFFGINIHASLLPLGRSYCPIECALERGMDHTGITIHKLSEHLDRGDILLQKEIPILPEEDSVDLYLKCDCTAMELLTGFFDDMEKCWASARPQTSQYPYWRIQHIEEARYTHELTLQEAKARYRIYNRMVRVRIKGRVYFVKSVYFSKEKLTVPEIDLGDIWLYALSDGHVRLGVVQAADHRVWDAKEYPFR